MGKNTTYMKKKEYRKGTHPIWRGIGFAMMILIPIISYFGSEAFLLYGSKYGWTSFIGPDMLVNAKDPFLAIKIGLN